MGIILELPWINSLILVMSYSPILLLVIWHDAPKSLIQVFMNKKSVAIYGAHIGYLHEKGCKLYHSAEQHGLNYKCSISRGMFSLRTSIITPSIISLGLMKKFYLIKVVDLRMIDLSDASLLILNLIWNCVF